jgi:PAS domain S-box-containing protein
MYSAAQQQESTNHLVDEINIFIANHFNAAVLSLATNRQVQSVVAGSSIPDNPDLLHVLSTAREVLEASIVYALDARGTVVGCSPYDNGKTLTGNNYRFRPYFTNAMAGRAGTYAAVGVTTGERGLYFSRPVHPEAGVAPAGVLVIKIPMAFIDAYIHRFKGNGEVLLLTQEGIVFAATRSEWMYKAAEPLTEKERSELIRSRKFHRELLDPMPVRLNQPLLEDGGRKYIVRQEPVGLPGWKIVTLRHAPYPLLMVSLLEVVVLFTGFTMILVFFFTYRGKKLSEEVRRGRERRRIIEASGQAARQELETILAASLVGITLVKDGYITSVNRKMSDIFGYSAAELVGRDIRMFFQDRDTFRKFVRTYARQLAVRDLEHIEYSLKRKDGRMIPCSLSGKAIDQNDLSRGVVWVVEDIRERKKSEEELQSARTEAEAASRAKSEFLANMSHEIRTPMNGIIGIAEMLHDLELNPARRRHLGLIVTSARRLMKIINDILDFSKNEMERLVLDNIPFSLRKALNEVLENFSVQAMEKKVYLKLEIEKDVPDKVIGDETRLMQVLYNLVGNGVKFTDRGVVVVRLSLADGGGPDEKRILFEVVDTGIGISPDRQESIFEAFAQADFSHTRRYGGTGLGLPISRRFVQLMGGDLKLESRKGVGSRFWFVLLMEEASDLPESQPQEKPLQKTLFMDLLPSCRILLAEDNPINTALAVSLLEMAGLEVTAVQNGQEAVQRFMSETYDCILMDVQMPDMDGYEAVRQIRRLEEERGGHIPIIAMTACAMDGDREKCLAAGMDDYLSKPIDRIILFNLISRYLSASRKYESHA